jgi:hypothetical protein
MSDIYRVKPENEFIPTAGDKAKVELVNDFMKLHNMTYTDYCKLVNFSKFILSKKLELTEQFSELEWHKISAGMDKYEMMITDKTRNIKDKVIERWQVRNLEVYGNTIIMKNVAVDLDLVRSQFKLLGLNVEFVDTNSDHYIINNLDKPRDRTSVMWGSRGTALVGKR